MTIGWQQIQDVLKGVVAQASGLEARVWQWRDEAQSFIEVAPRGSLNILTSSSLGVDERRYVENALAPLGQEIEPSHNGLRLFTLSLLVENVHTAEPGQSPRMVLERVRTRLRMPSALEAIQGVNCSLVSVGPVVAVDYRLSGRVVPAASMDVFLGAAITEQDLPFGYIESVELSTDIKNQGGVSLPTPPNLDEHVIP